jgi:toxin FitB
VATGEDHGLGSRQTAGAPACANRAEVSAVYLLDTNVVSELRKPKPHGAVLQWIQEAVDTELHISAVTIGEIQAGIELTRQQDEAKATELEQWLELVATSFNILPMDAAGFREWARLMHRASDTVYEDAMIAATAKLNKLTVVTRNVADFKPFGVKVLNPFATPRK